MMKAGNDERMETEWLKEERREKGRGSETI